MLNLRVFRFPLRAVIWVKVMLNEGEWVDEVLGDRPLGNTKGSSVNRLNEHLGDDQAARDS